MEYYSALKKKEGNPVICDNMDEPRGHYAKGNTQGTERQMLHDLTYMWNLKKSYSVAESTEYGGCQGVGQGRKNEVMLVKWYQLCRISKLWRANV